MEGLGHATNGGGGSCALNEGVDAAPGLAPDLITQLVVGGDRSAIRRAASIMLWVRFASIPPSTLRTIVSSAPNAAMWLRFSTLNASEVTMRAL
jgi:hypothetical protein